MADDHDKLAKGDNAGSANASGTQGRPQSVWDMVGKKIQDQSGTLANQAAAMDAADLAGQRAEDATAVRPSAKVHSDLPTKTPSVAQGAPLRGGVEDNSDMKTGIPVIPAPNKPERPIQRDSAMSLVAVHNSAEASHQASAEPLTKPVTKITGDATKPLGNSPPHETAGFGSLERPTAPARPHEPEVLEPKKPPSLGSSDPVRVPKVVPEPHTPAPKIRETEAQKPKEQGLRAEEKYSNLKVESPAPSSSSSSSSVTLARAVSTPDRIQAQETKITPAPPLVRCDSEPLFVKVTDSKVFQAIASSNTLAFGRHLDPVVKPLIELSPHDPAHPNQLERAGKSLRLTGLPELHSDQVQRKAPVLHTTDQSQSNNEVPTTDKTQAINQSHSTNEPPTTEGLHPTSNTHGGGETQGPGEFHATSEFHATGDIPATSDIHATSEIHDPDEIDDTGEIHATDEIDDPGEIHATDKTPTVGKKDESAGCAAKTYVVRGLIPDKRYITGGELAFVAIMALASASRVRPGEHAAEQGLSQTRREYILVEEEPWLSTDYKLPPEQGGTGNTPVNDDYDERIESSPPKLTRGETKKAESQTSSASPEQTKDFQQRKILLRPQIMVQVDDNLAEMAEALFNDSRLGHLIADLNARTIDQRYSQKTRIVRLTTRQRLSLPVYQDIIQFEATELSRVSDWELITIVESTALDKELLDDHLSGMLGINSKNRDPLM